MSILPQLDVDVDSLISESILATNLTTPKEYAWDFENNDFLLKDGKFQIVEGKEALKIWIWKALKTVKMTYSIYSDSYGHDLDTLIGQGFSKELIETESKRLVWECISINPHITGIKSFSTSSDDDVLIVSFTALTDQGGVDISV